MPENEIKTAESTKPKRKYNRKAPIAAVVAAPQPPNPAIVTLESQVIDLVGQRMGANQEIANAMAAANEANSRLQVAQMRMKQIEHEVNYRLGLVQQMKGSVGILVNQVTTPGISGSFFDDSVTSYTSLASTPSGVGSIPPQPAPMTVVEGGRRIRSESAEAVRAAM